MQGLRSTNWQVQNRQGGDKDSIANGEAKELMCTTHGHELRQGIAGRNGSTGQRCGKAGEIGTTVIA